MSVLQSQSQPVLVPLIAGELNRINQADQLIISAWATMFTMVVEFAHPRTMAVSFAERKDFRKIKRPLSNWQVRLAKYGGQRRDTWFWHRGTALHVDPSTDEHTAKCNVQATTFAVGKLLLQTFSTSLPDVYSAVGSIYSPNCRMSQIWPVIDDIQATPDTLADFDIDRNMAAISAVLPSCI